MLNKYLVGSASLSEAAQKNANCDKDGKLTSSDTLVILDTLSAQLMRLSKFKRCKKQDCLRTVLFFVIFYTKSVFYWYINCSDCSYRRKTKGTCKNKTFLLLKLVAKLATSFST